MVDGKNVASSDGLLPAIKSESDASNTIVIAAQGNKITIFVNGEKSLTLDDATYARGGLFISAWDINGSNASPQPSCTFSNIWVWEPTQP